MRCNNCGWQNPEGVTKCVKCNQILDSKSSALDWSANLNYSKDDDNSFIICEQCGYQLADNISVCPECGYQRDSKKTEILKRKQSNRATIADFSAIINEKVNPKATQLDTCSSIKEQTPRATVVDAKKIDSVSQIESTDENYEEKSYSYKLLAIDRPVIDTKSHGVSPLGVIELKCSMKLDLKLNEIVLIGGLRFTRIE